MVIYRPLRETLAEAMLEAKEFETIDDLKEYLLKYHNANRDIISMEDISITDIGRRDPRSGWWDVKQVRTNRFGEKDYIARYGVAQCIGEIATTYTSYDRKFWESQSH